MTKGIVVVVVVALLTLAGCGGKNTGSADTGVGDTEVATGGRLFKTADAETAKLGSNAQPGAFPRTVRHALGETKLATKPSASSSWTAASSMTSSRSASRRSGWRRPRARPVFRRTWPARRRGSRPSAGSAS